MELVVYVVWKDNTALGYTTTQGVNSQPIAFQWRITSPNVIEVLKMDVWDNIGPVRVLAWKITPP